MASGNESVEVSREMFEETVAILEEVETVFRSSAAYTHADTIETHRKQLEQEDTDE